MPPQAVTLEPLVQGECVVTVLRLLGRTKHAHQPWIATFLWYEISAQGTGPLANISEKFLSSRSLYHSKPKSVIQSFGSFFRLCDPDQAVPVQWSVGASEYVVPCSPRSRGSSLFPEPVRS